MRASQLATVLLTLSPLASAWPSWLPDLDSLIVRRDSGGSPTSVSPTTAQQAPTSTGAVNTFNLNTGGISTSGSAPTGAGGSGGDNTNGTKTGGSSKHTMFNPEDPAGGVEMITPAATAPLQLYKIGDTVTWVWNYTNLQGPPTAVDVLASVSTASRTYTLTQNMTFATQASYTWDTGAFQSDNKGNQLITEQYTLIIFDAESSISATPEAGYLGTFQQFTFGMYSPQPYTPLASGWSCASCSAAVSDTDKRAIGFALAMCVVTVLSFTWFVTGLGVAL